MKVFSENELWYMAGLLEGEGYFGLLQNNFGNTYINIKLKMTDRDIIDWVAYKWECNVYTERYETKKDAYIVQLRRKMECLEFLRGILPMMGIRRSGRITEILEYFDAKIVHDNFNSITTAHTC